MSVSATATIPTLRASRYAKQLVSHWGRHAVEVTNDEAGTTMTFPPFEDWTAYGVQLSTADDALVVTASAEDKETLARNCAAVAEHLKRFAAQREPLEITWS